MPFRARMKRAFTRSSSSSSNSSDSLTKTESRGIGDPKIYQPGEPMPRPKYRAPVDKKHKAALDAYTFGTSVRRQSLGSQYSPMGSRMPSRNNSTNRPTWLKRSQSAFPQVSEGIDDEAGVAVDALNRHSRDGRLAHLHAAHGITSVKTDNIEHIEVVAPSRSAYDHTPFTVADLNTALEKSISRPPIQTL